MEKYKQFVIKTFILFAIIGIVSIILLLLLGNFLIEKTVYAQGCAYVKYWVDVKNEKAKEYDLKGNKIVFLSGSNTLYGFNSKYAHEKTGLPVLNYGLHAGYNSYIFSQAKNILNSGDIVVLPLEFSYYTDSANIFSKEVISYIASYDKKYYQKELSLMYKLDTTIYMLSKIYDKNVWSKTYKIDENYYTYLNHYGDYLKNIKADSNTNIENVAITCTNKKTLKKGLLYEFLLYCKDNNIKVYATNPNFHHIGSFTKDEIQAYNNIKEFYSDLQIKYIGDINSGSYNKKYFFDTGYHLNNLGQKTRTDWIIDNILSIKDIKEINK